MLPIVANGSAGAVKTPSRPLHARALTLPVRPRDNGPRATELITDPRRYGLRAHAPVGAYAGITPWRSRDVWLRAVELAVTENPHLLGVPTSKRDTTSVGTFLRVLSVLVSSGDKRTGRDIDAHRASVAKETGVGEKTVQRVERIATRVLGLIVPVTHARPLTLDERIRIRHTTRTPEGGKGRQRGIPGLRAAATPDWLQEYVRRVAAALKRLRRSRRRRSRVENSQVTPLLVDCVPQPRRAPGSPVNLTESNGSPYEHSSASLRSAKGTRSARSLDGRGGRRSGRRAVVPGQRLAQDIARAVPWGTRLSPRRVAHHLADFERAGWTAQTWLQVADRVLMECGRWNAPDEVASPGGWVYWLTQRMFPDPIDEASPLPPRPQPCDHPECDHGWRSHPEGGVIPCPTCPSGIRSGRHLVDDDEPLRPDHEPLF